MGRALLLLLSVLLLIKPLLLLLRRRHHGRCPRPSHHCCSRPVPCQQRALLSLKEVVRGQVLSVVLVVGLLSCLRHERLLLTVLQYAALLLSRVVRRRDAWLVIGRRPHSAYDAHLEGVAARSASMRTRGIACARTTWSTWPSRPTASRPSTERAKDTARSVIPLLDAVTASCDEPVEVPETSHDQYSENSSAHCNGNDLPPRLSKAVFLATTPVDCLTVDADQRAVVGHGREGGDVARSGGGDLHRVLGDVDAAGDREDVAGQGGGCV